MELPIFDFSGGLCGAALLHLMKKDLAESPLMSLGFESGLIVVRAPIISYHWPQIWLRVVPGNSSNTGTVKP